MKKHNPQYASFGMPGGAELILIALMSTPFLAGLYFLWKFFRYLRESDAERRRLRIEVAKLGHELENIRKQQVPPTP